MNKNLHKSLDTIFSFLKDNRIFNHAVQSKSYHSFLAPYDSKFDRIYSLLHHIANTQSQPNLDKLSDFFQKVYEGKKNLNSLRDFILLLNPNNTDKFNYQALYESMISQSGWGKKTSALFTKTIYHLHNGQYDSSFGIFEDAPVKIDIDEKFYLPVDAVIVAIFHKLEPTVKWDFDKVNRLLHKEYQSVEMEVWDDLWFWGFITQRGSGLDRDFVWNEQKYWALLETDKNPDNILNIKEKTISFLSIFRS